MRGIWLGGSFVPQGTHFMVVKASVELTLGRFYMAVRCSSCGASIVLPTSLVLTWDEGPQGVRVPPNNEFPVECPRCHAQGDYHLEQIFHFRYDPEEQSRSGPTH